MSNNKKILITGANGQLANSLNAKLKNKYQLYLLNKKKLDITNKKKIKNQIIKIKPDILINCAAYNNVALAEKEKNECYRVNSLGPKYLSTICKKNNIYLIHFSTDYVFFGKKKSKYVENDIAIPKSYYGYTKLAGEKHIMKISNKYLIIRVSWLYYENFNNFVTKIINLYKQQKKLNVTNLEFGIPTYCDDLSDLIKKLLYDYYKNKIITGIFHFTSKGKPVSRYYFAKNILKIVKKKYKYNYFINAKINQSKSIRPKNSALDALKIAKYLNIELPNWKISLEKMLSKNKY